MFSTWAVPLMPMQQSTLGSDWDRKQLCRISSCDPMNKLNVHQICTFAAMNAKHTGYIGKLVLRGFREVIVHLCPAHFILFSFAFPSTVRTLTYQRESSGGQWGQLRSDIQREDEIFGFV